MVQKITLLEAGFGTQLSRYVEESVDGDPLWTAKFLVEQPNKCAQVHKDFVIAGSEILKTVTYQASLGGFKKYLGLDTEAALKVIKDSVQVVRDGIRMAEQETGKKYSVKIAGSCGSYGAHLHDGSEYTGSYCERVSEQELMEYHRPRVAALLEGGVDLLAFETVPCIKEALTLTKLLKEFPSTKAWISFSIKDGKSISSGENFCNAAAKCWASSSQLLAIGANCFNPAFVIDLFKPLSEKHPEITTMIYPNSGEKYDIQSERWLNQEQSLILDEIVPKWFDIGISFVGGCCRTNSDYLLTISKIRSTWQRDHPF